MESEPQRAAEAHLLELQRSTESARREAYPTMPVWFWLTVALFGPAIVASVVWSGWMRVAVVALCVLPFVAAAIVFTKRARVKLRPPGADGLTARRFVAMGAFIGTLMVTNAIAGTSTSPWILVPLSFVAVGAAARFLGSAYTLSPPT